ncbi:STAS domain-containing protein [Methylomonas sp. AM2-LC]|uniref:STAS domain-containing protein n=1 Tax=Methylomonas sp. AM2-LC TaxID=3153301 RepID=UPI0032674A9E
MAENQETSLIGYDPLVWLNEPVEELKNTSETIVNSASIFDSTDLDEKIDTELLDSFPVEESSAFEPTTKLSATETTPVVTSIALDSIMNIRNVAELHERFCLALDGSNKIDIDASAVTVVDTATLQLLLILKQTAIKMQKQVVIDFPSDKFIEACDLLGISALLEVDKAVSGFF